VTFANYPATCNGTLSSIYSVNSCKVPISALIIAPFSIPWGSEIFAQVSAQNIVGTSAFGTPGGGAIILTNPDAPLNLYNDVTQTSGSAIGLAWT